MPLYRYSRGSITLARRSKGLGVWTFRWKDESGRYRGIQIGTMADFRTRQDVSKEIDRLGLRQRLLPKPAKFSLPPERERDTSTGGYVYLLQAEQFHKIGMANNVGARIRSIQSSLPLTCKLIHAVQTGAPTLLERILHRKFKRLHHRGEWFKMTPEDVALVIREMEILTKLPCHSHVTKAQKV